MASTKNYIVQYDVITNATQATEGLVQMASKIEAMVMPAKELSQAISNVGLSIRRLKGDSNFMFEPQINVDVFNRQLRAMVSSVRTAAEEMHSAIYGALSGSPVQAKTLKSGINSALSKGPSDADLKNSIAAYQKRLKELGGKKGAIQTALNENKLDIANQLKAEERALKKHVAENKRLIGTASPKGSQIDRQPALTNITPAAIREWGKVFGNARTRNLTVNIRGTATNALEAIAKVETALNTLQAKASFTITPYLNNEAFIAAERKLGELAALSKGVVAPLTSKSAPTKNKAVGAKSTRTASTTVAANIKPSQVKKALKEIPPQNLPVIVRITGAQIKKSLSEIPRQTLPVSIKLMWEKGAVGRQAQLKELAAKVPPITLHFDISGALVKLNEFVAAVRAASPQTIALTTTGAPASTTTPAPASTTASRNIRSASNAAIVDNSSQRNNILGKYGSGARNRLYAQAYNSTLPYAKNNVEAKLMIKHRRFFNQAIGTTGIIPTPDMAPTQALKYLQGVSTQMQKASVAVPWQLQSHILDLEKQINQMKGIGGSGGPKGTFGATHPYSSATFDKARKWTGVLTGPTSFGVRTPMAVDMAKGMGVMFAIGGAMSAIGNSFSQAMDYQNVMRTTQAILQNGTDSYSIRSFKNMENTVREVGIKTKFSAPEVASAAKFLAMAGYDIDAINHSIRPIADLALIGDQDLGETADKMTNIMTTFKIPASQMRAAANIMATTATRTNTDLMMLAESAKYGGGVAQMYGHEDPNLFADTMAIFGVMGNAGIQASSAGTSLRMMYQNIFNPNKKQKAILDMLRDKYNVLTTDMNGGKRSMADIIIDIANKVDPIKMPDIIGKLFRITAQPGANAALMSAVGIAMDETGGNVENAKALVDETNAFVNKLSGAKGANMISTLAKLIQANRASVNGDISGSIAESKQSTIQGLWAQVTSTFTEGIVKAFESRTGGFEGMLVGLRDYLAKPETVQMLQNLLDLIIEIGKVMAYFVKIWADFYNAAPDVIKWWVTAQMAITQIGTLIMPIMALGRAFIGLKNVIKMLASTSLFASASISRGVTGGAVSGGAATAVANGVPVVVGTGRAAAGKVSYRNMRRSLANNAILAGQLALSGADRRGTYNMLKDETRKHYAQVQKRASKIYFKRGLQNAFYSTAAIIPGLSFKSMFVSIGSTLTRLSIALAKFAGVLLNPISLMIAAVSAVGISLYKLKEIVDGNTEAQKQMRAKTAAALNTQETTTYNSQQWHRNLGTSMVKKVQILPMDDYTKEVQKEAQAKQLIKERYAPLFVDFQKDASDQNNKQIAERWRKIVKHNPAYKLALGRHYDSYAGEALTNWSSYSKGPTQFSPDSFDLAGGFFGDVEKDAMHARELQRRLLKGYLMTEATHDEVVQKAVGDIIDLHRNFRNHAINPDTKKAYTQSEIVTKVMGIRKRVLDSFPVRWDSSSLTVADYRNSTEHRNYDLFQEGAMNIVDSYAFSAPGTITKQMEDHAALLNRTGSQLQSFSNEWYDAVGQVISNYHMLGEFTSDDGKTTAMLELTANMLPDHKIDFSDLRYQIEQKIGKFTGALQVFGNMMTSVYAQMIAVGEITLDEAKQLIDDGYEHQHISKKTAHLYWTRHIKNNPQNKWWREGITWDQYWQYVQQQDGTIKYYFKDGTYTTVGGAREAIRQTSAADDKKRLEKTIGAISNSADIGPAKSNNPSNPVTTPSQAPTSFSSASDNQMAYSSPYERSVAKPTQVVFNVNEFAHFDRTAITSSADERDIMQTMEERLVNVIYQCVNAALNQANSSLNMA